MTLDRRTFLGAGAATGTLILADAATAAVVQGANERLRVGVMGTGGRGTGLAGAFQRACPTSRSPTSATSIAARADAAAGVVAKASGRAAPRVVTDFRRILDDKAVDVLVVATCNHWHAPAAILACAAGKHVYVEKPCSHNPREGELLVAGGPQAQAAGADGQPAPQLRRASSRRWTNSARAAIGRAYFAQSWYTNNRRDRSAAARQAAAARGARLRPLARPGPAPAVPRQLPPLQLALVLALGQRRARQQRHPHDRPVPLGPRRRLPDRASPPPAAATASRTTRKRPTRTWSATNSRAASRSPGKACRAASNRAAPTTLSSTANRHPGPVRHELHVTLFPVERGQAESADRKSARAATTRTSPTSWPRSAAATRLQQRDRGGPQEHAAVPPRQHRPTHGPPAALQSSRRHDPERQATRRPCGPANTTRASSRGCSRDGQEKSHGREWVAWCMRVLHTPLPWEPPGGQMANSSWPSGCPRKGLSINRLRSGEGQDGQFPGGEGGPNSNQRDHAT